MPTFTPHHTDDVPMNGCRSCERIHVIQRPDGITQLAHRLLSAPAHSKGLGRGGGQGSAMAYFRCAASGLVPRSLVQSGALLEQLFRHSLLLGTGAEASLPRCIHAHCLPACLQSNMTTQLKVTRCCIKPLDVQATNTVLLFLVNTNHPQLISWSEFVSH